MLQSLFSRTALIFLTSAFAVLGVACSADKQTTETVSNQSNQQSVVTDNLSVQSPVESANPVISPEPEAPPPAEFEPSSFEMGLDKAAGAVSISQSAQSVEDWNLVANQFQDAIALMKQVTYRSPHFVSAQRNIAQYRLQVKYALQKARLSLQQSSVVVAVPQPKTIPKFTQPPVISTKQTPNQPIFPSTRLPSSEKNVFVVPIKRRIGGTPIVEVTFNNEQKFDMIVDTGASGTVITQLMAKELRIIPVGKAKANTASSRAVEFPVGYVDSMAISGVRVNRVPVAIAGVELETGLLGHDFFGKYDITIKRNVIEFRPQLRSELNSVEIELAAPIFPKNSQSLEFP